MREIQREASALGARLFRNNVGVSFSKEHVIRYGLCIGSSDLIGWTAGGKFLAVEVKTQKGTVTKEQRAFLEAVTKSGGVAGVCRTVDDLRALLHADGQIQGTEQ